MGQQKKWSQAADLLIDDDGGLVTHPANATITPIITVVSVSASAKLSALLTLNAATKRITLRPHATGIYMDNGTASAASDPLGTNSIEMNGTPALLGELQFYAAAAIGMTVIEEG